MSNFKTEINGINVFDYEYNDYRNKNEINALVAEGMCYRLSVFLNANDISYDSPEDVYNNTSAIRDGNRLDIHDNYEWENGLEISFIYSVNGTCWAVLYDTENDIWYGEIEIPCP